MKVGDLVHNVPYDKYGVILSDPRSIHDAEGRCAEKIFSILWEDGSIHSAGSTLLDVVVAVDHRELGGRVVVVAVEKD